MSNQLTSFPMPPHLNSDLRLALSTLYSLPVQSQSSISENVHERPTSSLAHEYLLQFQSRNQRRRLHSQPKNQESGMSSQLLNSQNVGSTWLSCVFLVSSLTSSSNLDTDTTTQPQIPVHYAEALFAAQTMFHRLRRVKLSEAIDIEFEPCIVNGDNVNIHFPPDPQLILDMYRAWILQSCHPSSALYQLVRDYRPSVTHMNNSMDLEERIKGEMSLLVLASAINDVERAFRLRRQQATDAVNDFQKRPLLATLSLALSTVAARIRYTPSCLPDPAPHTHPIVNMILESIFMIQSRQQQQETSTELYYICLVAIPDAVLQQAGGDGGAYGRFSLEQRCFAALTKELKTQGMIHVWRSLQEIESNHANGPSAILLLQLMEAWAKHVPLPSQIVEQTIPLILQSWQLALSQDTEHEATPAAKAAVGYWIAIMESGALTADQVLLSSLAHSNKGSNQPNKKRQSSKSKRRENIFLEERTTDDLLATAKEEVRHRGETACALAKATWPAMAELLRRELRQYSVSYNVRDECSDEDVEGNGPIGAVTACATACLPHILRTGTVDDRDLFVSISQAIQDICANPSRAVRSFAAESLYALHETLQKCWAFLYPSQIDGPLLDPLIVHFCNCAINLTSECRYPPGYFADLTLCNDDDLENERNDVRDLLRTLSAIPSFESNNAGPTPSMAITVGSSVLLNFLNSCDSPIQAAAAARRLFPETPLHSFSALAKSINACASLYKENSCRNGEQERLQSILRLALKLSYVSGSSIVNHFPTAPINEILPLSRLFNLALASLSPMLSMLLELPSFEREVIELLAVGIEASGTSLLRLPELTGPSTVRSSRFDIRGAMRSPGGEDHVGVLTLLRLSSESTRLAMALHMSKATVVTDLCSLHDELKRMELQRGPGVFHGIGVFPKSRRILIGIICRLESMLGGRSGAAEKLIAMFELLIDGIAVFADQLDCLSAESLQTICENVFDAGAFSPLFVRTLFNVNSDFGLQARCLNVLHETGNFGFKAMAGVHLSHEVIHQWNRLRAALFTLLCRCGPSSSSEIFREDVISEEGVPAGLFIQVLTSTLSSACRSPTCTTTGLENTLAVLIETRQVVLEAITSTCGFPVGKESFNDPRPGIAETWFSAMNALCIITVHDNMKGSGLNRDVLKKLLLDTFVAAIVLLLYCSLEKTKDLRCRDPGMTLDGPQGLVMMEFLESYFRMGCAMLQEAGQLLGKRIPVDSGTNRDAAGMAVIGAALFRGSQGSLPPWAVENIPSIYSALFDAMNNNVNDFVLILDISMSVRLAEHHRFGGVEGGKLLSGKFFEKMNDKAKASFLSEARELAQANNPTSWKRLKALIKQACGGKKKDTDFNQRPALTKWDGLDRI
ncbi:hypothetical protein IV203_037627 [Nitzschia inconspicua]|uniref:Uncharacterized protein n=1 Tax=Nitzschia inconspicua TaxID=303405 RepID=A0A9K3LM91_9STRA|nr:hypothetical protein IV203_037627 [Nitzschia inconspicua]